jgi:hypothetical protein
MPRKKTNISQNSLFPTKRYTQRYIPVKGTVGVTRIPAGTSKEEREKILRAIDLLTSRRS